LGQFPPARGDEGGYLSAILALTTVIANPPIKR
jgi:hypothetical protein